MKNEKNELIENFIKKFKEKKEYPDEIRDILLLSHIKKFKKEQFVYQEDQLVEYFYIIIEGKIEISKYTTKYLKRIIGIIKDGDVFGFPELYGGSHVVNTFCLEDSIIACVTKEDYFKKVCNINSIINYFNKIMASLIAAFEIDIIVDNGEQRILAYLKWLKLNYGLKKNGVISIPKNQTHEKIGFMLSLTRETVTRILKNLKDKQLIDFDNHYYYIKEETKFDKLTDSTSLILGFYGSEN
ncbi:MAG: hypothetical protein A2086_09075 [Spirochaetes bacterium GWD1_27_9]|nr:MAG: hypothetical protein A2086_09075 [Spirochaetes bacterium GWD1_27_9]